MMTADQAIGFGTDISIMSLLALSAYLVLLVGRISFGQQAFFGLGAYASALATVVAQWHLAPALLLGMGVGALASALVALPTLRLSGLHYAVATLAFAEMLRIALLSWQFTVERDGEMIGPDGSEGFGNIRFLLHGDVSPGGFLMVCLLILAGVLLLLGLLRQTRLGLALRMVGHDEQLSATQGLSVLRLQVLATAMAGALAALGGGLYAHRATYIEPALFEPMLGVHAVGYALIGGLGVALGPLLGVLFDIGLLEATRVFAGWRMVVFGGLIALFLRWRPRGLLDETLVHRLMPARLR